MSKRYSFRSFLRHCFKIELRCELSGIEKPDGRKHNTINRGLLVTARLGGPGRANKAQ